MNSTKKNSWLYKILFFLLFSSVVVFWFTKLDSFGITQDEITLLWISYLIRDSIEIPINTINFYTGSIQSYFFALFFSPENYSLSNIRLPGVVFNLLAFLLIIYSYLKEIQYNTIQYNTIQYNTIQYNTLSYLSLFLSQSAAFLMFPKIAWEVNLFNFFFFSLLVLHFVHYKNKENKSYFFIFSFLLIGLLACYNHIIFSSVYTAIVLALFIKRIFYNLSDKEFKILILSSFVVFNILLLYVYFYFIKKTNYNESVFIFPVLYLMLLSFFLKKTILKFQVFFDFIFLKINPILNRIPYKIQLFFIGSVVVFLLAHNYHLIEVWSGVPVFVKVFSYHLDSTEKIFLRFSSFVVFLYFLYNLWLDIKCKNLNILSLFVISYLFVFSFYIQIWNIQYYQLISLIAFIYMSLKLTEKKYTKFSWIVIFLLLSNGLIVQKNLYQLSFDNNRKFKEEVYQNTYFTQEVSSDYFSFDPVIDYCIKNKIGIIESENLGIPYKFEFFKLIYPELKNYNGKAIVNYEKKNLSNGFVIKKVNKAD